MLVGNSLLTLASREHGESALPSLSEPMNSFTDAYQQCLEDRDLQPEGPGVFVYGMSRLFGQTFTRRLSNFAACFGLGQFFLAQRDYPILKPNDKLAQQFLPSLSTMNEKQSTDATLRPHEIRYEILPGGQDKDYYSVVYYIGFQTEELPIPVLGKLYNLFRPILYGSHCDWEAVQVDIDRNSHEPIGLSYETSNYANRSESYQATRKDDLHLKTKISRMSDGTWVHQIQQKNGSMQTSQVRSPFQGETHAALCLVAWNGSMDVCERVASNQALTIYALDSIKPQFLDIDTYRNEGFDLRATWVDKHMNLMLPKRQRIL